MIVLLSAILIGFLWGFIWLYFNKKSKRNPPNYYKSSLMGFNNPIHLMGIEKKHNHAQQIFIFLLATVLLPVLAVGQDRIEMHGKQTIVWGRIGKYEAVKNLSYNNRYDFYNFKQIPRIGTYIDTTTQTIYQNTSKVTVFYDGYLVTSYVIPTPIR